MLSLFYSLVNDITLIVVYRKQNHLAFASVSPVKYQLFEQEKNSILI